MLKEIQCSFFSDKRIKFHPGLNIILGDNDAKNSIGKSSALMAIDFIFGGDSLLNDDSGAIKVLGHHQYNFSFEFEDKLYFFSRGTDTSELVYVCDENYSRQSELSIDQYRRKLKEYYKVEHLDSSFRSIVSPFSRIWKKGALDPDHPFSSLSKEPAGTALSRLVDLFGHSSEIAAEKKIIEDQKKRKKLIHGSMDARIIPNINKTKYKANIEIINENNAKLAKLKQGFIGALNAYEELFDQNLRILQQRKNGLLDAKNNLQFKITRLLREISGITPQLTKNIGLVAEFFPTVNTDRLQQVESFHHKIGTIVKKELNKELSAAQSESKILTNDIEALENEIKTVLSDKGMPDDLFMRVFDLKELTDKAVEENNIFEQKVALEEAIKLSGKRINGIYLDILNGIQSKINLKLNAFNKVVYGPARNSSALRINSANSYSFSSPDDSGTGKSYAGLIGFDLSVLSLTCLPFFIHDSVIYKNIEIPATKKILKILSFIKKKQVFLSFDEAKKYGPEIEEILIQSAVLKLSHTNLLFSEDWRDKKSNSIET